MGSIRDKFIALGKAGGNRKDFFNLAKSEGLTDKEKLAKKTINNPKTKVFAAASKLNMPGTEKTKTIKNRRFALSSKRLESDDDFEGTQMNQ